MSEFDDTTVIMRPESRQPCEVLLVDDDELVRERLMLLLQKAGYLVTLVQFQTHQRSLRSRRGR